MSGKGSQTAPGRDARASGTPEEAAPTVEGPEPASGSNGFSLIGAGAGARLLGMGLMAVLGMATTSLAVRLLGPASYGVLAFSLSAMTLIATVGRLGLEPGVARALSAEQHGTTAALQSTVRDAFSLVAVTTALGAAGIFAAVWLEGDALGVGTRALLALGLCGLLYASNVASVTTAVARGLRRVLLMEIPNSILTSGKFLTIALLAVSGASSLAYVAAGYGVAAVVAAVAGLELGRRLVDGGTWLWRPDLGAAREAFTTFAPFAVTILATIILSRFDVLVLGLSASSTSVGIYEPILKLVEQLMLLVPLLVVAPYLPLATDLFDRRQWEEFADLYRSVSKLAYVAALPAILLLTAFPEVLLHALYGDGFPARPEVAWLLLPGFAVNLVCGLNTSALSAVGRRRSLIRVGTGGAVAMVLLAIALVPAFGLVGAAIATSASYVVYNLVASATLYSDSGLHPVRRDLVWTVLSSSMPMLIVLWGRGVLDATLPRAAAWALGAWALWVGLLFATGSIRRAEIARLLPKLRAGR